MPSIRSSLGLRKHIAHKSKSLDPRNGIASAKNGFSALASLTEEQETATSSKGDNEPAHGPALLSVPELTAKLGAIAITEEAVRLGVEEGWKKRTRRYGHNRSNIGKSNVGKSTIPDGDWNCHKSLAGSATYGRKTGRAPSSALGGRNQFVRGLKTLSGVAFAEQNPGAVVWHWDHRPVLNRTMFEDDPQFKYLMKAPDNSLWIKKGRSWIIVARPKHTVTEISIYSYDDEGLGKKLEEVKWEYLSVKAPKIVDNKPFVNQSSDNSILDISTMKNPDEELRASMVAHYVEAITRDIDVDELRYVGDISFSAREMLQRYVKDHIGKAPDDH